MQIADRNGLYLPFLDQFTRRAPNSFFVKRDQLLTRSIHAAGNAEPHALGHERRAHIVFERIHLRAVAVVTAHLEDVLEPRIGDDAGNGPFVLKYRVEAERGAVNE